MRPVVSKGFHGRNAKPICYLRSLPLRLRGCHLPPDHDLSRIQVRIEVLGLSPKNWPVLISSCAILSSCNSRNLNLSPFCQLTSTSTSLAMQMWQPSVLESYGYKTTSYVERISGPLRDKYPDSMRKEELITSLTQVIYDRFSIQEVTWDILGSDTLQRLWQGHCHREHLLWRFNCVWWVAFYNLEHH